MYSELQYAQASTLRSDTRHTTENPEMDHWASFRSFASYGSDLDLLSDVKTAKWRGLLFLAFTGVAVVLFLLGLYFPLIDVVLFPDGILEERVVISLMGMLAIGLSKGAWLLLLIMFICVVCIPLVLLVGILFIVWDNFLAIAFGANKCLSVEFHALLVGVMYVSTSYQALMVFLPLELMCFFSGFGQTTELRWGFYFLSLYCFVSIALCQAVEGFKLSEDPDMVGDDDDDRSPNSTLKSVTGFQLRRKFSSMFPSLPGIKDTPAIDTYQVTFFMILFLLLLIVGWDQPLLDIRVMLGGVALERMVLSLKDMFFKLQTSAPSPIFWGFAMLVIVFPVLYGSILAFAGIFDCVLKCCLGSRQRRFCLQNFLRAADLLRPWVMIDVFSITLVIILYAMQNDYVKATIPEGIVRLQREDFFHTGWHLPRLTFGNKAKEEAGDMQGTKIEVFLLQLVSGIYLIVGSSFAVIFLRWFWSTSQVRKRGSSDANRGRADSYADPRLRTRSRVDSAWTEGDDDWESGDEEETAFSRFVCNKACRCLFVWILFCFLMHSAVEKTVPAFELMHMNAVMSKTMPKVNKLMTKYLPQSYGSCAYPPGKVPQPCYEDGYLDKEIENPDKRITVLWMSGLNTMQFTNVSFQRTTKKDAPIGWNFAASKSKILNHYELSISGVLAQPRLFLRIEQCEINTTSMTPLLNLCKIFFETDRSCCEPNRRFHVQIAAECHFGDDALSQVRVQSMHLDSMTVIPIMHKKNLNVRIANKNITKTVMKQVRENLRLYLIEQKLFRSEGVDLTFPQLLNRILRFNTPNQEFHCR